MLDPKRLAPHVNKWLSWLTFNHEASQQSSDMRHRKLQQFVQSYFDKACVGSAEDERFSLLANAGIMFCFLMAAVKFLLV